MSDWLFNLLIIAAALLLRQYVICFAVVKGRSMLSTFHTRDVVAAIRSPFLYRTIRRGDVVLCHYPGRTLRRLPFIPQTFIKRVAALPGETIEMIDGMLYINGVETPEAYLDPLHNRLRRSCPPRVLQDDEYFVMGDNRDSSNDSRSIGPIKRKDIRAHVVKILFHLPDFRRTKRKR